MCVCVCLCLFPTVECNFLFQAILYDDKGSKLDALHVRASDVVTGEQLESDRSGSPALTLSRDQKKKNVFPPPNGCNLLPQNGYNLPTPKWLQSPCPQTATISLPPNGYNLPAPKRLQSSCPQMASLPAPKPLQFSCPQMATIR